MSYQEDLDIFYDKINVEYATYVATTLANFGSNEELGFRTAGSQAETEASNFIFQEFINIGLQNVRKEQVNIDSWDFKNAALYYVDKLQPKKITLSSYANNCIIANKEFELVYVGRGTRSDYQDLDVKDKLVLIDLDEYIGCQVGVSAYQAKKNGAYGIIVAPFENDDKIITESLNYDNFIAPANIPTFSMSLKDAKALKKRLGKRESLSVILNCYNTVTPDQQSYNVIGEIPGEQSNELILVMAHYDGIFHSFHDGASGCGLLLSLARTLNLSDYKPKKTIIFIAHSARIWGMTNSSFNWSVGSYQQIRFNHPEWAEKAFIAINLEGFVAQDDCDSHMMKTTYEYQRIIQSIEKLVRGCPYKKGALVDAPTTILSDDFPYSQSGVPTVISYRPDSEYVKTTYRTNYDLIQNHFSPAAYLYCHKLYGTLIILFDQMKIKPFNFEALFEALENSLDYETYHQYKSLYLEMHKARWSAKKLYDYLNQNEFSNQEINYLNKQLHYIYLEIQECFVRLSWNGFSIFPHEAHQENIFQLREAIRLLKNQKVPEAIIELCKIDLNLFNYYYDKDTFDFYVNQSLYADERHLAWGKNLLLTHLDLSDIIETLRHKSNWENLYPVIEQLNQILVNEQNQQAKVVNEEIHHLKKLNSWIKSLYKK